MFKMPEKVQCFQIVQGLCASVVPEKVFMFYWYNTGLGGSGWKRTNKLSCALLCSGDLRENQKGLIQVTKPKCVTTLCLL